MSNPQNDQRTSPTGALKALKIAIDEKDITKFSQYIIMLNNKFIKFPKNGQGWKDFKSAANVENEELENIIKSYGSIQDVVFHFVFRDLSLEDSDNQNLVNGKKDFIKDALSLMYGMEFISLNSIDKFEDKIDQEIFAAGLAPKEKETYDELLEDKINDLDDANNLQELNKFKKFKLEKELIKYGYDDLNQLEKMYNELKSSISMIDFDKKNIKEKIKPIFKHILNTNTINIAQHFIDNLDPYLNNFINILEPTFNSKYIIKSASAIYNKSKNIALGMKDLTENIIPENKILKVSLIVGLVLFSPIALMLSAPILGFVLSPFILATNLFLQMTSGSLAISPVLAGAAPVLAVSAIIASDVYKKSNFFEDIKEKVLAETIEEIMIFSSPDLKRENLIESISKSKQDLKTLVNSFESAKEINEFIDNITTESLTEEIAALYLGIKCELLAHANQSVGSFTQKHFLKNLDKLKEVFGINQHAIQIS